jgi:ubiquitin-protein ligase
MDTSIQEWAKIHDELDIEDIESNDKTVVFTMNDRKFKIEKHGAKTQYFVVMALDGTKYSWLDDLNVSSIERKLTITKIMDRIKRFIESAPHVEKVDIVVEPTVAIDSFNISQHKEKVRLQNYVKTSKSHVNISAKVKRLFPQNVVSDMIINEYLNLWKKASIDKNFTIDVVDNNLYHWRVKLTRFNSDFMESLKRIEAKHSYNCVVVDIMFNDTFYPNYPPLIKILRPRLQHSLMHRLSNSRMFQFEYWDPVTSMEKVVDKITQVIDKWGSIDTDTPLNNEMEYPNGAYMSIEGKLLKLAAYINTGEVDLIDKDYEYIKFTELVSKAMPTKDSPKSLKPTKDSIKSGWKSGTGYGHGGASKWNIDDYVRIQEERDKNLLDIIRDITLDIENVTKENRMQMFESVSCSLLIKFIKDQLNTTTLLDMEKRKNVFMVYFTLLQNFAREDAIYIYNDSEENNLFNVLKRLKDSAVVSLKLDPENEFANMIFMLFTMIEPLYTAYHTELERLKSSKISVKKIDDSKPDDEKTRLNKEYVAALEPLKFDTASVLSTNYYQKYKSAVSSYIPKGAALKRLSSEIPGLMDILPIHRDSSVFVRVDDVNMSVMRALITGPPDTPYDSGCFIFDICMPQNYPAEPPGVHFRNTGNKRFNPNLYEEGKVCLSILNTYVGPTADQSEKWNKTSTLGQVLVSIQGQILIENPFFNEPGYERQMGTADGKRHDREYNNRVRLYTMEHAMLDLLKSPGTYPQFTEIIKKHFRLKRDTIINMCSKWVVESEEYVKETEAIVKPTVSYYGNPSAMLKQTYESYLRVFGELKTELMKL